MSAGVVWKYPLAMGEHPLKITMPEGARVLHVDAPRDEPHLWALIPTLPGEQHENEDRLFWICGTGHALPDVGEADLVHRGTFIAFGGTFVGHVFEEVEPSPW